MVESLKDLQNLDKIMCPALKSVPQPTLGFVFTGQGAQWVGMGRELTVFPTFEQSLEKAEHYLLELGCPWRLRDEMFKAAKHSSIDRPDLSQPICTSIQIGLVDLLRKFGIYPAAVVGHSSGEVAAAYTFGAISAKGALKIAYCRGVVAANLAQSQTKQGAMVAVGRSETNVKPYIHAVVSQFEHPDLTVACVNSNTNVTVSGDKAQIDVLQSTLDRNKIFARTLRVDVAYHSTHMQHVAEAYRLMIQDIEKENTSAEANTMISSVTGARIAVQDLCSPEYWVSNMVSSVRFSNALGQLFSRSGHRMRRKIDLSHRSHLHINMLVEIGPHSALQGPIRDILKDLPSSNNIHYASLMNRDHSAVKSTLNVIGRVKSLGYPVELSNIYSGCYEKGHARMTLSSLPEYQFDHSKTYWYESRTSKRFRTHHQGKLDLLGKPVPDWNPLEAKWRNNLRLAEMPWMEDHVVNGSRVYPGAGMLVMAVEAAHQMADSTQVTSGFQLKDIEFLRSIHIPQDSMGVETQFFLHLSQDTSNSVGTWSSFRLCAYEDDEWYECCRGLVRVKYLPNLSDVDEGKEELEELKRFRELEARMTESCKEPIEPSILYEGLGKSGLEYGSSFQKITNGAIRSRDQAKGDIKLFQWPAAEYFQPHVLHPVTLDAIFHLSLAGYAKGGQETIPTMVPTSLRFISISENGLSFPEGLSVKTCTWTTTEDNRGTEFDLSVLNVEQGAVLAQIQGLRLTKIAERAAKDSNILHRNGHDCYHIDYQPDPELLWAGKTFISHWSIRDQAPDSVAHYLNILIHKNPALNIVEINGDPATSIETLGALLDQDGSSGRSDKQHFSYHITNASRSIVESGRKQLQQYPQVVFSLLSNEKSSQDQGFEVGAYDILVARQYQDAHMYSSQVRELLKPDGGLLLCQSSQIDDLEASGVGNGWQEYLRKPANLSPRLETPESVDEGSPVFTMLIRSSISEARMPIDKKIVLVAERKSDQQIKDLGTLIEFYHQKVLLTSRLLTSKRL